MDGSKSFRPIELASTGEVWQDRRVPRKVRQLVSDLERGGFLRVQGGKGSHRKFVHPKFRGFVLISGHDGDDAMHYLEKQVKRALQQVQE